MPTAASGPSSRKTWRHRIWRVARILLALAALGLGACLVAVWLVIRHFEQGLPSIHELKASHDLPQVTRVVARDGTLLAELFDERRTVVPIDTLPPRVKLAVLAAEDAGFYEHEGLNYWGILRAVWVNLRWHRTRQGGSTITQQVVKIMLLDPERSVRRKIREFILARRLEQQMSKDEILELYLNDICFGHGRYGIEEAARFYFGKSAKDLTIAEAALLAGVPRGPELYSPKRDPIRAQARRTFVLDQMLEKKFIDKAQYDAAMSEPVHVVPVTEPLGQLAPEVVQLVKRTLDEVVGESRQKGGYTVTTTIDPKLQTAARKAVRDNLDAYLKRTKLLPPFAAPAVATGKKKPKPGEKPFEGTPRANEHKSLVGVVMAADDSSGTLDVRLGTVAGTVKLADYERYNPQHLPPSQFAAVGALLRVSLLGPPPAPGEGNTAPTAKVPLRLEIGPEAAMVAIDVRTREVLALIGNYEAASGGLDRATQSHRQPGSSFKPFVYSYALYTRRFTPATMLDTNPGTLSGYKPSNYEDSEGKAPMRMREALAHSVNVAAVHVLQEVGPANVVSWAQALGVGSRLGADLSLALGSYEVTPFEMAGAYATLAAFGMYAPPVVITKVTGPDGAAIPLPPKPPSRRVLGEAEAYLTTSLLTSVVDHGTAASARALARPVAGKTGTSNQAKDAWFVGYSTDIACATWTGFDDGRSLGAREAGASAALPAWIAFMKAAHEKKPPADFPRPAGVASAKIDPKTGLLAYDGEEDAIEEVFLEGTVPEETSTPNVPGSADAGLVVGTAQPDDPSGAQGGDPSGRLAAHDISGQGAGAQAVPAANVDAGARANGRTSIAQPADPPPF